MADKFDNLRIPITAKDRVSGNTPYYGANGIQDYVEGFTHDGEFVLLAEDGANDLSNYPVQYVNGKVWVNNHAHVIAGKKDALDNKFLMNSLKQINIEPYLVGGGRAKLNADVMMRLTLKISSVDEQIKIGQFFSTLDQTIAFQQRKLENYQKLKKSLLQKMFPKNNELLPEIRFIGYESNWEQRELGKIYDFLKGKSISLESFCFKGNKAIAYGHLYTIYNEVINDVKMYSKENGIKSKKGDILFPGSSTVPNGTAQANAILLDNIELGGDIIIARAKENIPNPSFISYQINSNKGKLYPITVGTTITHMYGKDIAKIKYGFPELEEQAKIGRLFSNLDQTITLHQRKCFFLNKATILVIKKIMTCF